MLASSAPDRPTAAAGCHSLTRPTSVELSPCDNAQCCGERQEHDGPKTMSKLPHSSDSDTMENADEIEMASEAMLRRLSLRSIPGDAGAGELGWLDCRRSVDGGRLEPREWIGGELAVDLAPPPPGFTSVLTWVLSWVNCLRESTPTFAGSMRYPAWMAVEILWRDMNPTFTGSTSTPCCCGHRK